MEHQRTYAITRIGGLIRKFFPRVIDGAENLGFGSGRLLLHELQHRRGKLRYVIAQGGKIGGEV